MVDRLVDWQKQTPRKLEKTASANPSYDNNLITLEEVSVHCHWDDCWIVIYDRVYDITAFLTQHPPGGELLLEHAGCDATLAFFSSGHTKAAVKMLAHFLIGILPREDRLFPKAND